MDLLKKNEGFTILETLTSIIILGLLVGFTIIFFNKIFSNSKILLRSDALILAEQEIENCKIKMVLQDTSYANIKGNLILIRKITMFNGLRSIEISVHSKNDNQEILKFQFFNENKN
ncbi:MAG: type II secretion system protein [Ignavibacteriales bacterium]|nr:type II secretion system protein [Ignavibacteriales bacterium]